MVNEASMLFHEHKAVSSRGEVLLHKMQEARAMALRIQRITDQASNLNAEQTAEINRNAIEINRLLTE
jgi:predicted ATP-dependent serine protease